MKFASGRWSAGQIISAVLVVLFLAGAMKFFYEAARYRAAFERWKTDKPVDIEVDFSKPGTNTGSFIQTCHSAHSECVGLLLPETFTNIVPAQFLSGLSGSLAIFEPNTSNAVASASCSLSDNPEERFIPLFYIAPFKTGTYRFQLQIFSGATNLHGIPQRLEGQYLLCGLEAWPAVGAKIGAIGCLGLAFISALLFAFATRRRRALLQSKVPESPLRLGGC